MAKKEEEIVIGVHHPEFRASSPQDWAFKAGLAASLGDKASLEAIRHRIATKQADPSDFRPEIRKEL